MKGWPGVDNLLRNLHFKDGLIPAVVTDAEDGRVLTLCYMDRQALRQTLVTGKVHVFRRSQGRVMLKGQASGHVQRVRQVRIDCEGNSLLVSVQQQVAACHAGYRSCYFRTYDQRADSFEVTDERIFDPDVVYGKGD